ncbi:MAG: AI-2E family transporter [Acidisphaera sp.]|nr:AI-2E family transporter [Acidisphaera sp.]
MPQPATASPSRRAQITAAEKPNVGDLMALAVAVVIVSALYFGRQVLVPITLAILLSFVLAPLVELLRRLRLPRVPSVILAVVLALGIILSLAGLIGSQIASLAQDVPLYQSTIERKLDTVRGFTVGRMSDLVGSLGRALQHDGAAPRPASPAATPGPPEPKPVPVELRQPTPTPLEMAERILSPVVDPLATAGIVFIVAIFILLQQEDLRDRLIRLFGSSDLHRTTAAMDDAARRLSKYFLTQLALNTSFGVIIGLGLMVIGVPSPVLWGILAGLMRFVPYVGSFISGVLPVALAAAVDPGWSTALWTAALFLVSETLMGQAVEPLVYGHSTGLSPVAVVIAAVFWTWLWGSIGLILSTPLTVCLVVLGRHIERLEFLDVLFGDRPALTPVESFYQRMLAGDPDEVQEYAELLLKDRALSAYYDEVAMKGLQLAAGDAIRGVLRPDQIEHINASIRELVDELAGYDDRQPASARADDGVAGPTTSERELAKPAPPEGDAPPMETLPPQWGSATPVLCVPGRGPLDEAAALMLVQLLGKHGIGARLLPRETVSRAGIATLDVGGVAVVCISYLEISGTPSHLRYLLRRLRQRLPHTPIVVGLWPPSDPVLRDPALAAEVGADHYVTSLRDAVTACLETARKAAAEAASPEPALVA